MANNIAVTPGSGASLRTDDLTGTDRHMPFTRLDGGTGTTENNISAGQKTMANSLPVVIASNQSALTVSGAAASGTAVTGNPALTGGSDGTNARTFVTDTAGRQLVSGAAAAGSAVTGSLVLVGGSDGTNARNLLMDTSGRPVVVGAAAAGSAIAGNPVLVGGSDGTSARAALMDTGGRQIVIGGAASGAAVTGNPVLVAGSDGTNAQTLRSDSTSGLWVQQRASTTGGSTGYRLISAATTNATSVKATAGTLYAIAAFNTNAAARYLKLYNKASAPTVGTDTPLMTFAIPGNTAGAGFTLNVPVGIAFGTGLAFALTTGIADSDIAAVAANEIVVNLAYQ